MKGPPWSLSNLSNYQFYLCPECENFRTQCEISFCKHMRENHAVLKSEGEESASAKKQKLINVLMNSNIQVTKIKERKRKVDENNVKSTQGVSVDCQSCGYFFNSVLELRKHINEEHSEVNDAPNDNDDVDNNDPIWDNQDFEDNDEEYIPNGKPTLFPCQNCDRKLPSQAALKTHLREQHAQGDLRYKRSSIQTKLRCSHCDQDFRSYHYLKTHSERDHEDLPIKFTKRVIKSESDQEELIKETDGETSTYKCDHCDYVTTQNDLRGLHMQKEHNDTSRLVWFKCDQCPFKCRQRKTIWKHKQEHKDGTLAKKQKMVFRFVKSAESFNDDQDNELKLKFSDIPPEDMKIKPTKVVLQCLLCDREFNYFHALRGHFESNHADHAKDIKFKKRVIKGNDGLETLFAEEDGNDKVYSCTYCDYVTHMSDLCGIHMEKEHNDKSMLVFVQCDKCNYSSKTRGNLINHKRLVHENYRPKRCTQCDRRFATKALLDEHVQRSHNPEGILCDDCGKIFSSPKLLKRHELWHHKPEEAGGPVPCHICGKMSIHKYALQKHIQRVHRKADKSSQGLPCHICGKFYAEKKNLKQHLLKAHSVASD